MSDPRLIALRMLDRVDSRFDKRQSSLVYNAIAPSSIEFANLDILREIFIMQTFLTTADGGNLDRLGKDYSIPRLQPTFAVRIAEMYDFNGGLVDVVIGSRFAEPSEVGGRSFVVTEQITTGVFKIQAEQAGTAGNAHFGDILPLFVNNFLSRAVIIGTQQPARDMESDKEYRERLILRYKTMAFGGNQADYIRFTKLIDGVGDLKVYNAWQGGGTVKLSVIDASYDPITPEFSLQIKQEIDPIGHEGEGLGQAPMGHTVTIGTPTMLTINVSATLTLNNITLGQAQPIAEEKIRDYFRTIRMAWASQPTSSVFVANVISALLSIEGVINVTNVTLNGSSNDILLLNTPEIQELPYLGVIFIA